MMKEEISQLDLVRQDLIDRINTTDLATLLRLKKSLETPKKEIFDALTTEKLQDKTLRKSEIKIAKTLLKFMRDSFWKNAENASLTEDEKIAFSPEAFEIKEILDKSAIIKDIGLESWVNHLNSLGTQI